MSASVMYEFLVSDEKSDSITPSNESLLTVHMPTVIVRRDWGFNFVIFLAETNDSSCRIFYPVGD
jgi:hypothetical protein